MQLILPTAPRPTRLSSTMPPSRVPSSAPRLTLPLRASAPRPPIARDRPAGVPFADAAQAWFWTLAALAARRDGTGSGGAGTPRPCDPDDVIRALDLLYRRGGISLAHAHALRRWGERGIAPVAGVAVERADAELWTEALDRLEGILCLKGIVAPAGIMHEKGKYSLTRFPTPR